ncbi:hypothetical protein TPY_2063 [Sulfobacillus acidophilus TPY]|nr:hypothetical protein TPY_2063 [Sulfobacillus acidophilus TPY]
MPDRFRLTPIPKTAGHLQQLNPRISAINAGMAVRATAIRRTSGTF